MLTQQKLNRDGIRKLIGHGMTMRELSDTYCISRGWLREFMGGREPKHPGITIFINYHTKTLLQSLK